MSNFGTWQRSHRIIESSTLVKMLIELDPIQSLVSCQMFIEIGRPIVFKTPATPYLTPVIVQLKNKTYS